MSQQTPSTLVIWNPSAGSTAAAKDVREQLEQSPTCKVQETCSREEALSVVQAAVEQGCHEVIAAGGDGTVNTVLHALADCDAAITRDIAFGILPLGTGNDLSRTLAIPLDSLAAWDVISRRQTIAGDVFRFQSGEESRIVANMCTAGNTGEYLTGLTPEMKQRWGPFCYLRGVIHVLADLQTYDVCLCFDESPPESVSLLNLFVANGQTTGAGMTVAPMSRLDDGFLDVIMILEGDASELASLTTRYVMADFLKHPLVRHRRVQSLSVECTTPFPVTIDGDVVTETPFQISRQPHRISLICGDDCDRSA